MKGDLKRGSLDSRKKITERKLGRRRGEWGWRKEPGRELCEWSSRYRQEYSREKTQMCERTGAGEMDTDGRMGHVDGDLKDTAPLKASVFSGCGLPGPCWV